MKNCEVRSIIEGWTGKIDNLLHLTLHVTSRKFLKVEMDYLTNSLRMQYSLGMRQWLKIRKLTENLRLTAANIKTADSARPLGTSAVSSRFYHPFVHPSRSPVQPMPPDVTTSMSSVRDQPAMQFDNMMPGQYKSTTEI